MKVEIWSDINCPFCYIGKRKFEKALNEFGQKDKVEVIWRSFQLDPELKYVPGQTVHQYLAVRKGVSLEKGKEMNTYMSGMAKEIGLSYDFDKAIINNTLNAHRLLHLAHKHGVQNEVKEKLFAAYYTNGKNLGETETLVQIGESAGLEGEEIRAMLESALFIQDVQQDQYEAQQIGVQGVPFFVFNDKYAVSGARESEIFTQVLEKVWQEEAPVQRKIAPVQLAPANGGFCIPDGDCN
jgi:predicted DsbA family dithiol-disulfide isomerase